jgi:hypothetical protein
MRLPAASLAIALCIGAPPPAHSPDLLAQAPGDSQGPRARGAQAHPDSARLIASDIARFWAVVDRAMPDSLAAMLQRDYLDAGTPGVRDFIRGRILSAGDTLLAQAFTEGSADFVGEMISGAHINGTAHRYGLPREREWWAEFRERTTGTDYAGRMYGKPPGERPADPGYFIGYRIAQAYYRNAADKGVAIREILRAADVPAILARSGYHPQG